MQKEIHYMALWFRAKVLILFFFWMGGEEICPFQGIYNYKMNGLYCSSYIFSLELDS